MASNEKNDLEHWIGLIREWKESGSSQKEFCKEKGISYREFGHYKRFLHLSDLLESLPDEAASSYAFKARHILDGLDDPLNKFSNIMDNPAFSERARFNALYCSLVFLWQEREFGHYRQLVDTYENVFGDHMMFLTFRSQYYSSQGKSAPNSTLAVEYASKAKERAPNLPNVLHLFTRTVIELSDVLPDDFQELMSDAEKSINKAIAITRGTYARYYATKADLLGKAGRFDEAKDLIQKAIEVEPSKRSDYALRIGDYQYIRLKIQFLEHSQILQQKQKESINKLEEVRLRVVELLGILAAIIAFLVTSIQVGKGLEFQEAARLMIISGGVILIIFSSYSTIFFRDKPRLSQLIVLLFGAALVIAFYFLPDVI